MTRILTLAALAAVLAVGTARAQSTNTHTNAAAVNDWLFVEAAHASGMAELALSELGAQRATDPERSGPRDEGVHRQGEDNCLKLVLEP